jgi:Ni/Co efflux regulator RcnB
MDRRAFLNGLFGLAGVTALGGLTLRSAQAAPIARALEQADVKPEAVADSGRTPDGTEVDKAHYTGWRHSHRHRRRRHRRCRVVCHNRWRHGRRVRVCRRVYW